MYNKSIFFMLLVLFFFCFSYTSFSYEFDPLEIMIVNSIFDYRSETDSRRDFIYDGEPLTYSISYEKTIELYQKIESARKENGSLFFLSTPLWSMVF